MVRRSVLFSPGDRPEMLRKAPGIGADVVVFDLEDAVAPERKDEARAAVRTVLADPDFDPDAEVCVRVNPDSVAADLSAVLDVGGADPAASDPIGGDGDGDRRDHARGAVRLDSVMLPKVTGRDDIVRAETHLADRGRDSPVLALIESAAGVLAAPDIAAAGATDGVVFGAEDLAADLGATRTRDGTEVLYARERVVVAAAAAGVDAIDTVHTDLDDEEGLRADAEFAVELGYDGKLAVHPAQVGPINDAFTPSAERVGWARTVLAAREEAAAAGRGVFRVDGEMIDAPLVAQAERVVERAEAAENDRTRRR